MNKEKRIKELEDLIINAKKKYYSMTDDIDIEMSDAEYDLLEDELRQLDPNNKILRQVGFEDQIQQSDKVVHDVPMLSMDKVHTKEELAKWYNNKIDSCFINNPEDQILIEEPKIDGISGELAYKNGKFVCASTRGNGKIGVKINDAYLTCIKRNIDDYSDDVKVRGEFYIEKIYNMERDPEDQEPLRNICSGALKRKDKSLIHSKVRFIAYQLIVDGYKYETDKLDKLKELGFNTVPYNKFRNVDEAWEGFELYEKSIRESWPFETDGIILIFNNIGIQKKIKDELGDTDHHHKYAIAIKPKPEGGWTNLNDTEWNTSRNGFVKPVGIIDPIEIGSAIVNRATLNNITYIKTNDIQQFDKVFCVRANDVIPKIVNRMHTQYSKEISLDKCPSCGKPLQMKGVDYWCSNYLECPSQKINKFIYWFKNVGIKNLGPNMIDSLISCGHFNALWELYAMSREDLAIVVEKFCNLDRSTDTMKEFLDTFDKSKDQTCQEIIGNFGIPYIGIKTLEKMGVEDLNDLIKYKDIKYLRSDKVVEAKLCEWLNQDEKNFDDLFSLVKFIKPKDKKVDNRKYTFCITGEFIGKRRAKAIEEIENECPKWKFVSSVTKETDILIKSQEGGMSNKEISAVKYKIPILVLDDQYDINKIKERLEKIV